MDPVAVRNKMVWVDGHGYRSFGAAHALEALGNHVRWYDLKEPEDSLDVPPAPEEPRLPYKD